MAEKDTKKGGPDTQWSDANKKAFIGAPYDAYSVAGGMAARTALKGGIKLAMKQGGKAAAKAGTEEIVEKGVKELVGVYPLVRYLRAFDAAVSAARTGTASTSPGMSRRAPMLLSLWKWPPKPFW